MIDTHAHLTDEHYTDCLDSMIASMPKDNLSKIFTVAYNYKSCVECVDIAGKYDNIYAIIGIHPSDYKDYDIAKKFILDNVNNPKVVAIGEIGLDYHYPDTNKNEQKRIFVDQLQLAHEAGLPISIHVRDAIGDLLQILEEHKHLLANGGLIHCFSESVEVFNKVKRLGLKVAFGGVVTFKNAIKAVEVANHADLSDFVLETDCPYLTPEPLRGKQINEPKFVNFVAQKIAQIKGVSVEEVDSKTTANALEIFKKAK